IGEEGYIDASGFHHPKALAFLGDLRGRDGRKWTEVFVCDLPPFPWVPGEDPLEGSVEKRPSPPAGTTVWRLTHTDSLPRPGIQGPRHWPRSDRTGRWIAALLQDPQSGLPQLHRIDILDGSITQVTFLPEGVGSCFTWNPAGDAIACASGKQIVVLDPFERRVVAQSEIFDQPPRPEAVVFSPCGTKIAFTLPTLDTDAAVRNQVWCLELRQ
ncbi:MAG: TolB family protein, partial [Pirellulaceae bacterium]